LATTSVVDLLNFRCTNRVFHYEATKLLLSISAPPVIHLDSEDSMTSLLAFLRTRLDLVLPFRAFYLILSKHSAEVITEFGRLVGQAARRYSLDDVGYSSNEGHKLTLLLAASPNVTELRLETDVFLSTEDIRLLPTFKQLQVRVFFSFSVKWDEQIKRSGCAKTLILNFFSGP